MDQRRMHARVLMSWWDLGDRVVITRDGVESGAVVTQRPSYHGDDPLLVTGDDGEVITISTKDLVEKHLRIRMELREPGRLSPPRDGIEPWDLDPETLMGDGEFQGGRDPESLLHDNRIRAGYGLRAFRKHGSPADNVDQALADVLVDLLHLGDLLGVDPGWVADAQEHHRKEITGDY